MQDQITVDQLCSIDAWLFPRQHPEQIGGMVERLIGRHRILIGADARMCGDDHRYLRSQPNGLAERGFT